MLSSAFLERVWYGEHRLSLLLAPLAWCYAALMVLRRIAYSAGVLPEREMDVPVIVCGNMTVGGTGKTPLVIWLVQFLREAGYRPGVVCRGYGIRSPRFPQQVRPDSNPGLVGDEPVLIAQRTGCPVAVSPRRWFAARELAQYTGCDIIVCDDGLQHYALRRDVEIAVIDGDRRFGNGRCLPAGPLREPLSRLKSVDLVVGNGRAGKQEFLMEYTAQPLRSLRDEAQCMELEALRGRDVHAVAGIGNPARFFSTLRSREIHIIKHDFPDHHPFIPRDLDFDDGLPVVMTEKDAVKCRRFAGDNWWYLPVDAQLPPAFRHRLTVILGEIGNGQKAA